MAWFLGLKVRATNSKYSLILNKNGAGKEEGEYEEGDVCLDLGRRRNINIWNLKKMSTEKSTNKI